MHVLTLPSYTIPPAVYMLVTLAAAVALTPASKARYTRFRKRCTPSTPRVLHTCMIIAAAKLAAAAAPAVKKHIVSW